MTVPSGEPRILRSTSTRQTHRPVGWSALTYVAQPRWSHDGTRFIVKGRRVQGGPWSLHVVDARTGAIRHTVPGTTVDNEWRLGAYQWLPNREAALLARPGRGVVQLDLGTGTERMIVPLQPPQHVIGERGCAYAPDGQTLAYAAQESDGSTRHAVLRVRDASGTTRELLRAEAPDWLMLESWAPDGQSVYVVRQFRGRPGAGPQRREVWRVPINGGAPVSTGLRTQLLRGVAVNPDGRTLAYVDGSPTWRILAMEGIAESRGLTPALRNR